MTKHFIQPSARQSLPAVTAVTSANIEEFKQADKLVLIAYLDSDSDKPASEFKAAADAHRDDYLFGLSTDSEVNKAAGVKAPALVLYRSFDEPELQFPGHAATASSAEIAQFVKDNQTPLIDEVSQENYATYAQSGLPLAYLFIEPDNSKKPDFVTELKQVARKHKGKINFVTIDATKFYDHAKALNLHEEKWPAFVIQDLEKQLKYPLSQDKELTAAAVAEWSEQYASGKLEPILKSEPIPASQDESVFTVVGKNFESLVLDENKDVFIEFYAPW
jgi:protein disulfide-isomerase A1